MTTAAELDGRSEATDPRPSRITHTLSRTEREACRLAVIRVLDSQAFFKAVRLSSLLEYICRLELDGRSGELSEVVIGVAVFGRSESYNTSDDNIVRSTMRLLRQRLDTYYSSEGLGEHIRIEIPRGAYVPIFKEQTTKPICVGGVAATTEAASPATTIPHRERGGYSRLYRFGILVSLVAMLAVAAGLLLNREWRTFHPPPPDRFWKLLFPANQATILVPADTILMLYERASHHVVPLKEYVEGEFTNGSSNLDPDAKTFLEDLRNGRYTAITSVGLAADLSQMDKTASNHMRVKFCRDLQLSDLKQSNVILIGAEQNNPWVGLFQSRLNFHLDWDGEQDRFHVLNDHPRSGEPAEWKWARGDINHRGFGQIAFLRNLGRNGYVLIIAGTSMDGTRAASEFLLDPQKMNPILRQAESLGKPFAGFEVLLQAKVFDHGTLGSRVLGIRYHSFSDN